MTFIGLLLKCTQRVAVNSEHQGKIQFKASRVSAGAKPRQPAKFPEVGAECAEWCVIANPREKGEKPFTKSHHVGRLMCLLKAKCELQVLSLGTDLNAGWLNELPKRSEGEG